jgi:tetratricopeptide (TPR) repeat protein
MTRLTDIFSMAAAMLIFAVAGAAAQGGDRLQKGIEAHNAALAGDEGRIAVALALLGPEGWDRPPLALAYHGSVITLQASQAKREGKLMKALGLIDAGTKEIDRALDSDRANLELRTLRMENSLVLYEASPIDRRKLAVEDLACLRTRWAELKPEARSAVELDSGRLSLADKRLDEAFAFWRKAVREAPGSDAAARARKLLARYGD